MEERRIFCDICKKRVDEIRNDGIVYYEVTPIKGISTSTTKAIPPEIYMDMYSRKHYCSKCYDSPVDSKKVEK
jgi:hypothetical protein